MKATPGWSNPATGSQPNAQLLPRVLIVAEHASARFGGEALLPYRCFKHLREVGVDVHMLVHARTRAELLQEFPDDVDRLHFVRDSRFNVACYKLGRRLPSRLAVFTLGALSHLETQLRQRRKARMLVRQKHCQIVHEPIPVSPKLPSLMFGMSVPVIIGPMNGGMDYPKHYESSSRIERAAISLLQALSGVANLIMPGKHLAALLLVANLRTKDALPFLLRRKSIAVLVENGVDLGQFTARRSARSDKAFRMICVGIAEFKRVDLLLDACARLRGRIDYHLDIVGDGGARVRLLKQIDDLSLSQNVRLHGALPQSSVAELLAQSDVLVHPSMRECGGAVILEAMATELPVIAVDWGGPGEYVTPQTGILIPPLAPAAFTAELAEKIEWIARHSNERKQMGRNGRMRVAAAYDWRVKIDKLLAVYETVLDRHHVSDPHSQ